MNTAEQNQARTAARETSVEQTGELSSIDTPSPGIDARASLSHHVQNAPVRTRMISNAELLQKRNLADSMEAVAGIKRPVTPDEVSDQNTTRPVFDADEFEALMRGPNDVHTPVPTPMKMQTITMNADMFKEMQEIMLETKKQLQTRDQQLHQLQRAYEQHDGGLRKLDMQYGENAEEGGIEDEDESEEEEFLIFEEDAHIDEARTPVTTTSEPEQLPFAVPITTIWESERLETEETRKEKTEFFSATFGSPQGSVGPGMTPEFAAGYYGSTIAHQMQTPEFGNSGTTPPIPSQLYQTGAPQMFHAPPPAPAHAHAHAGSHTLPLPSIHMLAPHPYPYPSPMSLPAMQDSIKILSMELQQVRAEQAASQARQEACHAANMYELQGLKQMIIEMRSSRSASPTPSATPSVTITTKTGQPLVHVPASGEAMHQQTEVGLKNRNAYIRDVSNMSDLPSFDNVRADLDDGYPDLETVIEAWSRALADVCPASAQNHNGGSLWVEKIRKSGIKAGGNLELETKSYKRLRHTDPTDISHWTWEQFCDKLRESEFGKIQDPLQEFKALKAVAFEGEASAENIRHFVKRFQAAHELYEDRANEGSEDARSPGAVAERSKMIAQMCYDGCPYELKQVMNSLPHNARCLGVRMNLRQLYLDIDACKAKPELQLYKGLDPSKRRTPQAAAAGVNERAASKTPAPAPARIGEPGWYRVIMRIADADKQHAKQFELMLQNTFVKQYKGAWKPMKFAKPVAKPATFYLLVHPSEGDLQSFVLSGECVRHHAHPTKSGVLIMDETTTARSETKDKAPKEKAAGGDGSVRANAARTATEQENKERAEREALLDAKFDKITQVMQEMNQRLAVTPQDSISNVGQSSNVGPSSAGSTEIAQPTMRTANSVQISRAIPSSLNYVMPGSSNHMSHASIMMNGRQVRGTVLNSSGDERQINFSSMCLLSKPNAQCAGVANLDAIENEESRPPISLSSPSRMPKSCRRIFHLQSPKPGNDDGTYYVGAVEMSSESNWSEFLDMVHLELEKVPTCISHDVASFLYDETYGNGVQKGVVCEDEQGWNDVLTMMREEEERLGGELTLTISIKERQQTIRSEVTTDDYQPTVSIALIAMLILLSCSASLPPPLSPPSPSSPRTSRKRTRKREKRRSNRHKPVDFRCHVTRLITRDSVYMLQKKQDGVYVDMPDNPVIISDLSYTEVIRQAFSVEMRSFLPVILPIMSLILYVFTAAFVLPFSKRMMTFSGENNFESMIPQSGNAVLTMLTVLFVAAAARMSRIGIGAFRGGMWFRRALLPLGIIVTLGLTCAEGRNVPAVNIKGHNVTHGPRHAMDPHRNKITPTDFDMLGSLDFCPRTDDPHHWSNSAKHSAAFVGATHVCVKVGRSYLATAKRRRTLNIMERTWRAHQKLDFRMPVGSSLPHNANPSSMTLNAAHIAAPAHMTRDAARSCIAMNANASATRDRVGMFDPGCNSLILKMSDSIKHLIQDYTTVGAPTGISANGEFTTDGTGVIGMSLEYTDEHGQDKQWDIITPATFASQWNYDLMPALWWQRMGHSALYEGRASLNDPSDGMIIVTLYELQEQSKTERGHVKTKIWNDVLFFTYSLFSPVTAMASTITQMPKATAKSMKSAMYHFIFGHASMRRLRSMLRFLDIDVHSDFWCACEICSACKTHTPSRRIFERKHVPAGQSTGHFFRSTDPDMQNDIENMMRSEAEAAKYEANMGDSFDDYADFYKKVPRYSTSPGEYWHCDTIPLGSKCWGNFTEALIMVDDFSRMVFVYVMKDKTKESVAEALRTHFLKVRCQPSRLNFFTHRTTIKSDMGSEFINHLVKSLCAEIGCVQEFSCPGGGKWQNGTVERRIKELGLIARSIAEAGNMPDASHMYALWQAADILNVLPCSSNAGGTDETGLPPQYVYEGAELDLDKFFAHGSFCTAHNDADHQDPNHRISAAKCVYLSQAHHIGAAGHVLWDYVNRRRLIVPSISYNQWNYYPLRPNGSRHVTNMLTFAEAEIEIIPPQTRHHSSEADKCDTTPTHVFMDDAAEEATPKVTCRTRHQQMMDRHVGDTIRKVFFINGIAGKTDYYEGRVHSVTRNGKYLITYAHDNDSEEMDHRTFLKHRKTVKDQVNEIRAAYVKMHVAPPSCNCTPGEPCYHPWAAARPDFNPSKQTIAASTELRCPNATGKYVPRSTPVAFEEFDWLSMQYFGQHMDDARGDFVDIDVVVALASTLKHGKVSAYPPDPTSIGSCMNSSNWQRSDQGENTWQQAIMTEIENFRRNNVYSIVKAIDARRLKAEGHNIFSTLIGFVTKRAKSSTPEKEVIDKRKCRVVFGGHRCIPGRDFNKSDAYAPVPGWGVVKLQLALAALHNLKLKAFDCTAAYLQTPIDDEVYCYPPKGLMHMLGGEEGDVWKLNKAIYGHPLSARRWYEKLFTYLKSYGFVPMGNSATLLLLDRRSAAVNPGLILLNVYSDDGLGATSGDEIWDEFIRDFKLHFELEEKDPDYFLGAGIHQDESGAIRLDPSKYIREVVGKYDLDRAVTAPVPLPAGCRVYMPDEDEEPDAMRTQLYQQMVGSILYASLLRPDIMYHASQLSKVMSRPTAEHMAMARNVIQYLHGTMEAMITFRPAGADGFTENDVEFMAFSDSDWACAVDTRRSHGAYVLMLAGAAITWRSRSHKSVMLSTAAAEYYEASEACREIAFIRSILMDFYGNHSSMPPTPLYIDNSAAISMGQVPQFSEKQKHIPIRMCHLKECCADGMVQLRPIPTRNELADIGTKSLAWPALVRLRDVLFGNVPFRSLD